MRALSLILAAALVFAGSSVAGSSESLPGVGTFAYAGSALTQAAPQSMVLAAR
jgi:hypothetical protein